MRTASPDEINGCVADRYTLVHFTAGMVAAKMGMPFLATLAGSILWERVEDVLKDQFTEYFPRATHDRTVNAVSDTVAVMSGWMLVRYLEDRKRERELPVIARHLPAAVQARR